jgi:hypothetical protein
MNLASAVLAEVNHFSGPHLFLLIRTLLTKLLRELDEAALRKKRTLQVSAQSRDLISNCSLPLCSPLLVLFSFR